ncbi:MAG: hypothetical protein EOP45_21180, partial [Sphingobacteriaceae bacterium]
MFGEDSLDPVAVVKTDLPITQPVNSDEIIAKYSSDQDEITYWKSLLSVLWQHPPAQARTTTEWITAVDVVGLCKRVVYNHADHESTTTFAELLQRMNVLFTKITRKSGNGKTLCFEPSLIFKIHVAFHLRLQITQYYDSTSVDILF